MTVVSTPIERLVIAVDGADAGKYLHSQLSNDIASLGIGTSVWSLLLEPTGKIVALLRVTRVGEENYLLDTELAENILEPLLARLNRFKIRVKADISVTQRTFLAMRSTTGQAIPEEIRAAARNIPNSLLLDSWWSDATAYDVLLSDADVEIAGVDKVGLYSVHDLRVRCGWPAMNHEIILGETLPAASGVVALCVNFTKGCYPGQELVERMDSRGSTAPRTLRVLSGEIANDARVGDSVMVDNAVVGVFTSVTDGCALAYIARTSELGRNVSDRGLFP